jgi:hypothetical protein
MMESLIASASPMPQAEAIRPTRMPSAGLDLQPPQSLFSNQRVHWSKRLSRMQCGHDFACFVKDWPGSGLSDMTLGKISR